MDKTLFESKKVFEFEIKEEVYKNKIIIPLIKAITIINTAQKLIIKSKIKIFMIKI
jgi:hypothetical protein